MPFTFLVRPKVLPCLVQKLDNEQEFLHALPSAEMYERSYLHRDTVTHTVMATQSEFLITASADGHINFWKKRPQGIEFAKRFRAHVGPVKGMHTTPCDHPVHTDIDWGSTSLRAG